MYLQKCVMQLHLNLKKTFKILDFYMKGGIRATLMILQNFMYSSVHMEEILSTVN